MATHCDALVIGGGPAGATAALLLARAGWSVIVLERKTFPRRKVCGEFLSATNRPLLHRLDVGKAFDAEAGPPVRQVGLFARSQVLRADMPHKAGDADGWGRALSREKLDTLLLNQAARAGARVLQPWSAVSLNAGVNGHEPVANRGQTPAKPGGHSPFCNRLYTCRAEERGGDGSIELSASVVIAAHGSWDAGPLPSQVPRVPPHPADLLGFKAHFVSTALPAGLMPLLAFPGGYGGMVHCDGGRVSLSCCVRRDLLTQLRTDHDGDAGNTVLEHIVQSCRGAREVLHDARRDGRWLAAGPIRPGIRTHGPRGVFRVGNALGEAHPVVAEGISMALQGSELLADRLIAWKRAGARPGDLAVVAREHSAAWQRRFAPRLRAAAVIANWAMRPLAVVSVLPLLSLFPCLLTFGARLSGK